MADIALPIPNGLIQHSAMRRGYKAWQDTEGMMGDPGLWYFLDNSKIRTGSGVRRPQQGRGYNFTGFETITYQETITTIVDQDGNDLSSYLVGQILTPPLGVIYEIIVNGITYWLEEGSGLLSYRSIAGAIATINLNGSSESGFHTTTSDPAVRSRQNQVGYNPGIITQTTDPFPEGDPTKVQTDSDTGTIINWTVINATGRWTIGVRIFPPSLVVGEEYIVKIPMKFDKTWSDALIVGTSNSLGSGGTLENTISVPTTLENQWIIVEVRAAYSVQTEYSIGVYIDDSKRDRLHLGDTILFDYSQAEITTVGNVPIDESGNGKTDVLDFNVPKPYFGPCQFPTQIKDQSVGNFDGNLVLSFTDLTDRSIVSQEGTVTVQISGNNIQPVSGIGKLFYLEFDNGSSYIFIERTGLLVFDRNVTNALNGTWILNGSATESQWSTSPYQTPWPLLEGFNISGVDGSVIPADPANPGFDVLGDPLLYKGNGKVILPEPLLTYDRNFANVGELKGQGIEQGENITYQQIIADRSRLYNHDPDNIVEDMLVYDGDGFKEPIATSAANFNQLIASGFDTNDSAYKIQGFFIELIYTSRNITTGDKVIYSNKREEVGNKAGFWITQTDSSNIFIAFYRDSTNVSSVITASLPDGVRTITFKKLPSSSSVEITVNGGATIVSNFNYSTIYYSTSSIWIGAGSTYNYDASNLFQKHDGEIHRLKIQEINDLDEVVNERLHFPFAEEKGHTYFNIAPDRLSGSNMPVFLEGSAEGIQYAEDANKQYNHNLLYGYAVGGIFDGVVSAKLSEPNNTDTNWHIQGFKVEMNFIITSDTGSQALFSLSRNETGEAGGFIIAQSLDSLIIGIAADNTGIQFPAIAVIPINPNIGYNIVIWKRPNSTQVNFIVNEVSGFGTFSSSTIYYSPSGQSVTVATNYDYDTTTYINQLPAIVTKLRLTEIDDSDVEVRELINSDWENGDATGFPNIATDKPASSDGVWIDGTGEITGRIPGDPNNRYKTIQDLDIDNKDDVIKFNRTNNNLKVDYGT